MVCTIITMSVRYQLVKILIMKLLWGIWIKFCIYVYFDIAKPLVCKKVSRLCRDLCLAKPCHHWANPSRRFAYLCLDNIKNALEPAFVRNLFQNGDPSIHLDRYVKHSVRLPEHCLQFKYIEFYSSGLCILLSS